MQLDLIPQDQQPFNLIQEETEDGERAQRDLDRAREEREANEKAQGEMI